MPSGEALGRARVVVFDSFTRDIYSYREQNGVPRAGATQPEFTARGCFSIAFCTHPRPGRPGGAQRGDIAAPNRSASHRTHESRRPVARFIATIVLVLARSVADSDHAGARLPYRARACLDFPQ